MIKTRYQISLRLFDNQGKQIANEDVQILVNGQALSLNVQQELYYTKKARYIGGNISVDDAYYFEIKLSDHQLYPLAFTKVIPTIQEGNIKLGEEAYINLPTEIAWQDIKEYDQLIVWKNYKRNDRNEFGGGEYAQSTIKKTIANEDSYTVPVSFYKDSISTITTLNFEFHALKNGLLNPDLLEGSKLELTSKVDRSVRVNQ